LVCLLYQHPAYGQEKEVEKLRQQVETLERRVATLETLVLDLQVRLRQLETEGLQRVTGNRPARDANGWEDKQNWRRLRKGMTKSEVRRLLGEAGKISANAILGDTWYYPDAAGGRVRFDTGDRLKSWSEP